MGVGDFLSKNRNTIVVILIILVTYYLIVLTCNSAMYDAIISGFWKGDMGFLQDAGLSSFLLYLAPAERGTRACYLLAEQGDDLVINEPCSAYIKQTWDLSNWNTGLDSKTYEITFYDLETDDFPKKQKMTFYPKIGKMILSKNDTVYGMFYKDAHLTDTIYDVSEIKPEKNDDPDSDDEPDPDSDDESK